MADRGVRVQLWAARPQDPSGVLTALTDAEAERIASLRRAPDRARAATARALLRSVAGRELGVAPAEVPLEIVCTVCGGGHGKPRVVSVRGGPIVNTSVSYAGDWVLVAVTGDAAVGVDVERCDAVQFPGFDTVALTPAERAEVTALPSEERPAARASLWVRKEAVLKVHGVGLTVPPDQVQVGPRTATAQVLADPSHVGDRIGLAEVRLAQEYRACVAVAATMPPLVRLVDGLGLLAELAAASRTTTSRASHEP